MRRNLCGDWQMALDDPGQTWGPERVGFLDESLLELEPVHQSGFLLHNRSFVGFVKTEVPPSCPCSCPRDKRSGRGPAGTQVLPGHHLV